LCLLPKIVSTVTDLPLMVAVLVLKIVAFITKDLRFKDN
jgi:hypothetical protein